MFARKSNKVEDLIRYLEEIVEPTIEEFEKHPTSVRHAFLACVVTCHAADYLAHPLKPATLRAALKKASWEFDLVDEVGHAFKHVVSGPRGKPRMRAQLLVPAEGGVRDRMYGQDIVDMPRVTIAGYEKIDLLRYVKVAAKFICEYNIRAPVKRNAPSAPRTPRQQARG
jgi:hypothetical protein